jgi:hypothetical protein
MFNFSDIENISNNGNNYIENVIDRQNKEFLKKQNKISQSVPFLQEGFQTNHPNQTKGASSFRDPNVLIDNFAYSEPSEQTVKNTIKKSNKQTEGTINLVNNASYVNDPSITEISKQFNNQYTDYSQINNDILKNAKEYIDKGESIDVNVYVNQLSNDNNTHFVNLYNDDSNNNPDVLKYDNLYIDSCRDIARIKGYNNYSVGYTDPWNHSQCKISKDISNLTTGGIYIPNCKVGTDGKTYGGVLGNAIYQNDGNIPKYIGCYKDTNKERAMIPAGSEEHNNPVYAIGNDGCAPWGSSNGGFPKSDSQWIWYTENAGAGAPVNTGNPVTIRGTINLSLDKIVYCEVFCRADNICNIIVNGINKNEKLISDGNTNARNLICVPEEMIVRYPSNGKTGYIVPFFPGTNRIDLQVVNTGGPAGVIICFIQENNTTIENNSVKISSSINGTDVLFCTGGSFMSNWSYITNNNVVTPLSQSFSVVTCGKYAYDNGYQYFGLQNMMNNDPNTSQCFVSNDLNQSTKFGKWDGSITYEGNTLGIGPVSAVYSFNTSGNYDNMGKIGYISEDNKLLEYPSSMIQLGTSNSYTSLLNVDSPGNDINFYTLNKQDCEQKCNENTDCYGYLTSSNQCLLKNKNVFSYINKDGTLVPKTFYELNIKEPQVLNNDSCPKKIKNINSLDWDSFTKSQEVMNMDTTCRLEKINKQLLTERDEKETGLNWVMKQLSNGLSSFMTTNKTMTQQMKVEHNVMKENTSLYNLLYDKYKQITNIDNSNINNILANSQIMINQSRYFYILWAILAIAVVFALIMLIRKFTNT